LNYLKDKIYSKKIVPKGDLLCLFALYYSPINSDINSCNMQDLLNSSFLDKKKEAQFYSIRIVNVQEHLSSSVLLNQKKELILIK
jgi:hypothetical protein